MKNLIAITFVIFLFSCGKEPCQFGTIEIQNVGQTSLTIYTIPEKPTIEPGETAKQRVEICSGFDVNGNECGDGIQTSITYKFADGEMKTEAVAVSRCQTVPIRIN